MSFGNWRKWFRILHRDLGYLFFGLTVVYCVSGLALNHRRDWNPNYSISRRELVVQVPAGEKSLTKDELKAILAKSGVEGTYQSHYVPADGQVKVFFEGGNALLERGTGKLVVESLKRRPLLNTFNRLHLNPARWWTWFADAFTVGLLVVAITGLFLLKGRHGITRRGGILTAIGIIVPTILVVLYL